MKFQVNILNKYRKITIEFYVSFRCDFYDDECE